MTGARSIALITLSFVLLNCSSSEDGAAGNDGGNQGDSGANPMNMVPIVPIDVQGPESGAQTTADEPTPATEIGGHLGGALP